MGQAEGRIKNFQALIKVAKDLLGILPPSGKTTQEGHEFCVRGTEVWGPEVFSFLEAAMKD